MKSSSTAFIVSPRCGGDLPPAGPKHGICCPLLEQWQSNQRNTQGRSGEIVVNGLLLVQLVHTELDGSRTEVIKLTAPRT